MAWSSEGPRHSCYTGLSFIVCCLMKIVWLHVAARDTAPPPLQIAHFSQRRRTERKQERYFHNKPAGFPSDLEQKLLTLPASEGQVRVGGRGQEEAEYE